MCHGEIILNPQKKLWEKTIKSITKPFILVSLGGLNNDRSDLNSYKNSFLSYHRSIYRQISVFSKKNSIQSFGLGFSGFHEL